MSEPICCRGCGDNARKLSLDAEGWLCPPCWHRRHPLYEPRAETLPDASEVAALRAEVERLREMVRAALKLCFRCEGEATIHYGEPCPACKEIRAGLAREATDGT